jgi:hypothetical protein
VLCFPTNLTYSDQLQKYIISYGDNDSRCKMLVMSENEIENSLHKIPDPKDVEFLMV